MESIDQFDSFRDQRDIGIHVIDANHNQMAPFKDLTDAELQEIVNVNLVTPCLLTKVMIERLESREAKSALIMVGSNLGSIPAAGSLIYSSITRFLKMFARGLNYETKNIDVISYEPGEI